MTFAISLPGMNAPSTPESQTLPAPAVRPLTLALGGLLSLAAAIGIGRFIYTPILPFMVEDLGLSKSEAGLIASANFLGYLLGALLAALPGIPGSRRAWLLAALATSVLSTLAMALTQSMILFLILRVVGGMASAVVMVYASTVVLERLAAAGRGGLSAMHFAGVGCGIAVSAVAVTSVSAAGLGWREEWWAGAAFSLLALLVVARAIPPDRSAGRTPATAATGERRPGLVRLVLAYGLFGFGYVITATFLVDIVRAAPELRVMEPLAWLLVGLTAAPSVALWTWIAGKLGLHRAFALACLVEAIGVAASVVSTAPLALALAAALLGGTFMGLTALGLVGARRLSGGDPRRILAAMTAAFGFGQIVGPALAGLAHDVTGSFWLPSMAAATALVAAAALVAGLKEAD